VKKVARNTILNQFFYDFKRALSSKTMIITTVIIILLGSAIISFINVPNFSAPTQNISFAIYAKNSNYEILAYSYNIFGDPLPNVKIDVNLINGTSDGNTKIVFSTSSNSNTTGFAILQVPSNIVADTLSFNSSIGISLSLPFMKLIQDISLSGVFVMNSITFVQSISNSTRFDLLVFYVGENGTKPLGYTVYARPFNSIQERELGNLDNYYKLFKMDDYTGRVQIIIKDNNGQIVSQGFINVNMEQTSTNYDQLIYNFISSIMVLIIPLMVILAGYNLYGKDRINGILDFIHSLPITRTILGISRYASILIMAIVAIPLSLGFADLLFYIKVNNLFSATFWYVSFVGLIVTSCALLGLIMIFSLLVRSTGTLIAISIILWLIFALFWNVIIISVSTALGIGLFTRDYYYILLQSYFFNPMEYFSLLQFYVTNNISLGGFGPPANLAGIPANPAAYGITLPNLIITGLVWSVVPFIIYIYLLRKRE